MPVAAQTVVDDRLAAIRRRTLDIEAGQQELGGMATGSLRIEIATMQALAQARHPREDRGGSAVPWPLSN